MGRLRPACEHCGWVFFPDPKVAVAALITINEKILLVRRTNEPFKGKWSLPAGFMDAEELPEAAVERECLEETGFQVRVLRFFDLISGRTHANGADLLLIFLAEPVSGELNAGDDADDADFFHLQNLPPLAFDNLDYLLHQLT